MRDSDDEHTRRADLDRSVRRTFPDDEGRMIDLGPTWPSRSDAELRDDAATRFEERLDAECEEHMLPAPRLFRVAPDEDAPRRDRPRRHLVAAMAELGDRCDELERAGSATITEGQFLALYERLVIERRRLFARSADPTEWARIPLKEVEATLSMIRGHE